MIITFEPATLDHAHAIAAHARKADTDELWTQARATPYQSMRKGIKLTRSATTALMDGEPIAMFGVTPISLLKGWGIPWMVGSTLMDGMAVKRGLLRDARRYFVMWQQGYTFLLNFVDDRNTQAIRWLEWLGFTVLDPQPHGFDGLPFRTFYWRQT